MGKFFCLILESKVKQDVQVKIFGVGVSRRGGAGGVAQAQVVDDRGGLLA